MLRCSQSVVFFCLFVFLPYATSVLMYFSVLALVSSLALSISVTKRRGGGIYNKVHCAQYNDVCVSVWSLLTLFRCRQKAISQYKCTGKLPCSSLVHLNIHACAIRVYIVYVWGREYRWEACAKACMCLYGENSSTLAYEFYA